MREFDAVVDAGDVEVVQGGGHVGHIGLFAGVGGQVDLGGGEGRVGEDGGEEVGWEGEFGGGEAQPG